MTNRNFHCLLAAALLALSGLGTTRCLAAVWWDNFPRVIGANGINDAKAYSASAVVNGVASDPGWGPWFTYANDNGAGASNTCASYASAGMVSLSYNEGFGTPFAPIVELAWNSSLQRWDIAHQHWDWQLYAGGTVTWAGAWCWFDSFTNDLPANKSENSYFARPFTRMHPIYGGLPMTYPDGTIATGFLNNDVNGTNPANSRVYDAGGAKDVYGRLVVSYGYNSLASATNQQHTGEIWVPQDGQYSGELNISRDIACPLWTNFTYAYTRSSAQLAGLQGSWTDNFSPWDSFMSGAPVSCAFGEWSVALFRNYLTNNFTTNQLYSMGVLATNAAMATITNFDARRYYLTLASNKFGLASSNLGDAAWAKSGWNTQSVWTAYKIFRRQNGSASLTNYDQNVHAAAALGGQTNFALLVNDIAPASFGWARGNFDLASTELSLSWNLTAGSRGFGIPSFGRIGPVCKAIREHGRSRFATVWLYNDGYVSAMTNSGPVNAVFYEMLASHAIPTIGVGDAHFAGTPAIQTNFLKFVAQVAAPAFGARLPVEEVGIYLSTSTILSTALPGDASNFNGQYHQYAVWGWGTALSELHHQYRILPEWKLNAGTLQALKVFIVPNSSVFDPADVPTLQTWVTNGGYLIVTGDSGSLLGEKSNFAATNHPTLSALTGVASYSPAPAAVTNFLGSGAVYYSSNNIGYTFYNASGPNRTTQLPSFSRVVSNAFNWLSAQPVLISTNAPVTVGLTLYSDTSAAKTFLDLNNLNVDTNTYVITPAPTVDVTLNRPPWLTDGWSATGSIISPDGSFSLLALDVTSSNVHLRLPSVTNYLSVILGRTSSMGAWAVDASGTWSNPSNWNNGIVPSWVDVTATFTNDITGNRFVTNETARTVGNLVFGDADPTSAGSWTIAGSAPLTLQVTQGTPAISVGALASGQAVTISVPLGGSQGLVLNGRGTLIFSGTNTYGGATTVSNGLLRLTHPAGLASNVNVFLFTTGGKLDLAFRGSNRVASLYMDGVSQPNGVYGSNLSMITGSGFLQVGEPPPTDNTGSGGAITYTDATGLNPRSSPPYFGGYVVHTFTSIGASTLTLPVAVTANVLLVAGGGGGGSQYGGGGGAGGLIYYGPETPANGHAEGAGYAVAAGDTQVTVRGGGAGGGSATPQNGAQGANSAFGALTAIGGGYGAGDPGYIGANGGAGGSGGGASFSGFIGGTGTSGQGHDGGGAMYGGGGGAGAAAATAGGSGGDGLQYSISGAATWYAGGGGGINASGGRGGGGRGSTSSSVGASAGTDNLGGGGGGGWSAGGGAGGSGIVIVRYPYLAFLPPTLAFSGNAITMAGGVPVLHFDTVVGFRYGLDYRDSLTEGTWLAVISEPDFPPPDGWSTNLAHPPTTLTDTNAANRPKTFYRLKAASP